jgi:hypothetical protein
MNSKHAYGEVQQRTIAVGQKSGRINNIYTFCVYVFYDTSYLRQKQELT